MNIEKELLNSEILDGETYYKVSPQKSKLEELADRAYAQLSADLEIGKEYEGIVKDIFIEETNYTKLVISYEVDDNGISKNVADTYTFGGEYDEWYMTQLVKFIQQVDNLYKNDINWSSVSTICDSLKFLIGSPITIRQVLNSKGNRKNEVQIHKSFERRI